LILISPYRPRFLGPRLWVLPYYDVHTLLSSQTKSSLLPTPIFLAFKFYLPCPGTVTLLSHTAPSNKIELQTQGWSRTVSSSFTFDSLYRPLTDPPPPVTVILLFPRFPPKLFFVSFFFFSFVSYKVAWFPLFLFLSRDA